MVIGAVAILSEVGIGHDCIEIARRRHIVAVGFQHADMAGQRLDGIATSLVNCVAEMQPGMSGKLTP